MITKGIRGAITVDENSAEAVRLATVELLTEMISVNNIVQDKISHVIFTLTNDLNAAFPAKFARINLGWDKTAMMCFHELNVPGALPMCLRVLVVLNCDENFVPHFCYLKGAEKLRS